VVTVGNGHRRHHDHGNGGENAPDANTLMHSISEGNFDATYSAPFAVLGIQTNGKSVTGLRYLPGDVAPSPPKNSLAREVLRQIERYLVEPDFIFDLPLEIEGSEFRKRVWKVMRGIPAGKTLTYGQVAQRIGSAPRAVGGACGDNRIPLIIPCHRIVARNGIGGFMHTTGDLELGIKRWLLVHEQGAVSG
jgi:methylated-DNA-[protein]-cysteine S-methyltransferase